MVEKPISTRRTIHSCVVVLGAQRNENTVPAAAAVVKAPEVKPILYAPKISGGWSDIRAATNVGSTVKSVVLDAPD